MAERRQQESAQDGSGTPIKKRNNPSDERGALLANWTMLDFVRAFTRALPSRGVTQLWNATIIFYPVTRSSCRKLPSAEAVLIVCQRTRNSFRSVRNRSGVSNVGKSITEFWRIAIPAGVPAKRFCHCAALHTGLPCRYDD